MGAFANGAVFSRSERGSTREGGTGRKMFQVPGSKFQVTGDGGEFRTKRKLERLENLENAWCEQSIWGGFCNELTSFHTSDNFSHGL
jgi:hypothetical protein